MKRINIWTGKILFLLAISMLLSCGDAGSYENVFNEQQSIWLGAKIQPLEDSYQLDLSLKAKADQTIIWDWKALSFDCYYDEAEGILEKYQDLEELRAVLKFNQFVLENKAGQRRFYSELTFFGKEKQVELMNCAEDWFKELKLTPTQTLSLDQKIAYLSDYRVSESDSEVRLHYFFQPDSTQKAKGFIPIQLSSNWFSIPVGD